ncbi:MAG: VWA domain-containing protein, partial [Candidatus Riflebacteria bacterium]|nr:VWA domain-containing protein [Candidatus Riflebacteria bacterium]
PPPAPQSAREVPGGTPVHNTESYARIDDNPFRRTDVEPLSTFSIDVDTASYANVRRFLNQGVLPPRDAVRIEELVNYFPYGYLAPDAGEPLTVHAEVAACPWAPARRLVKIGLKSREIPWSQRPPANLVFLLDVSGSMDEPAKLPLVKRAIAMLVEKLGENDRVAVVAYASSSGVALSSTSCLKKARILSAIERLEAGGSTNGLAYEMAIAHFIKGGTNRVVMATDGDFNVGVASPGELTRLVEEKARGGVSLTVLGFGMGNLKDSTLEQLAARGRGNYAYIDDEAEARKVLVEQVGGTLLTVARDVKVQVEFNPARVAAYRLVGYENRLMSAGDFADDAKEAGVLGAGHTVTALYETEPASRTGLTPPEPSRYRKVVPVTTLPAAQELLTVRVRFKRPEATASEERQFPVTDRGFSFSEATADFRFAGSVAAFGLALRGALPRSDLPLAEVVRAAEESRGADADGYRAEFVDLVRKAARLTTASGS